MKIDRQQSPEEEELAKKRGELEELQAQLSEQELYLANLRAEIGAFEGKYLRNVGVLYAELDDWNAKIAELCADIVGTEQARSAATKARTQATESHAAAHGAASDATDFAPSPELKSLYREVAKRIHPDLAFDDADRRQRERLMTEANRAYEDCDSETLRRILLAYETSPESVRGTGVAVDLVRTLRQLKQIRDRLAEIEDQIKNIARSEIAILYRKAVEAKRQGRDLLAEMAASLQARVHSARQQYESELTRDESL